MLKTPEFVKNNTLLIPESLFKLQDAHPVMAHGEASIFYRRLPHTLTDIEFYTNAPCLVYVLQGVESFTSPNHEHFVVRTEEMLFLHKDLFMISDFCNKNGPLEAFLFFFDQGTIDDFLRRTPKVGRIGAGDKEPYKVRSNQTLSDYMKALHQVYRKIETTPELLRLKLLELLHLIEAQAGRDRLHSFLNVTRTTRSKRNIKRLVRDYQHSILSVQDLADLSGRSLSSFTRDFKHLFGTTPRQWMIDTRLERAFDLVEEGRLSITEISLEIGYDNISHFIKIFKNKYGVSPKKQQLKKNC